MSTNNVMNKPIIIPIKTKSSGLVKTKKNTRTHEEQMAFMARKRARATNSMLFWMNLSNNN
ncbi:MAG: hypothetical protein INQ03_15375 [Candidatus Heimdallarchaeota archaeon]|nr:hypothetical protein [Candidatus Heimdallarchaeota archaeon]